MRSLCSILQVQAIIIPALLAQTACLVSSFSNLPGVESTSSSPSIVGPELPPLPPKLFGFPSIRTYSTEMARFNFLQSAFAPCPKCLHTLQRCRSCYCRSAARRKIEISVIWRYDEHNRTNGANKSCWTSSTLQRYGETHHRRWQGVLDRATPRSC